MGEPAVVRSDAARADQLQFLRFLAFIGVYLFHTEEWLIVPLRISHLGAASVSFFFVLSGLVTGYSGRGKEIRLTLESQWSYMVRKITRIYPLYFLTTILAILYSDLPAAVASMDPEKFRSPVAYLVKNLLLIQSWFPKDTLSYNASAWFLSTLMFLNLLNLPLLALLNRVDRSGKRYLFYLTAGFGLACATVAFCYLTQEWKMGYWHYRFPPARMCEYICGMMLGFAVRDLQPKLRQGTAVTWAFTALEAFSLFFWVDSLSRPGNYWRNHIISWLIPNFLILAVFCFGMGWISRLFRKKLLVELGDMAFECFLIHLVIVRIFQNLHPEQGRTPAGQIFAFLFCLISTVVMAKLMRRKQK